MQTPCRKSVERTASRRHADPALCTATVATVTAADAVDDRTVDKVTSADRQRWSDKRETS